MSKKTGDYPIPFDKIGNQQAYPDWPYTTDHWCPNHEFEDVLTFQQYGRGRSSVTFTMQRESDKKTVSVFVSDFVDMIPRMSNGKISGRFTFTKSGQNYGCRLVNHE